jgi:hypothetical protein
VVILEMGSPELFAWAGFEPWWATCAGSVKNTVSRNSDTL